MYSLIKKLAPPNILNKIVSNKKNLNKKKKEKLVKRKSKQKLPIKPIVLEN